MCVRVYLCGRARVCVAVCVCLCEYVCVYVSVCVRACIYAYGRARSFDKFISRNDQGRRQNRGATRSPVNKHTAIYDLNNFVELPGLFHTDAYDKTVIMFAEHDWNSAPYIKVHTWVFNRANRSLTRTIQ